MRRAVTVFGLALLLAVVGSVGGAASATTDPAYSVPAATLAAALDCPTTFTHPAHEPVLLVHGTGTTGHEHFDWNYVLLLEDRGFDACIVTYPDRGLGDMQVSAEYVAHAVAEIHARTNRKVDIMGHSQGGLLPRWAIKFWPSLQAIVDDAVLVAPPSHGTSRASGTSQSPVPLSEAFFQFDPASSFVEALNAGDETPGDLSWSVLYTRNDELVQPAQPVPTAALDWQHEAANVRNVAVQDVCPGRIVDHMGIGTVDRLSQELVLDAFANPGPVDPARLGAVGPLCALPDMYLVPAQLGVVIGQFPDSMAGGFPNQHRATAEPPLKPYAAAALSAGSTTTTRDATAPPADGAADTHELPATGAATPLLAAAFVLSAGLALAQIARRSDRQA